MQDQFKPFRGPALLAVLLGAALFASWAAAQEEAAGGVRDQASHAIAWTRYVRAHDSGAQSYEFRIAINPLAEATTAEQHWNVRLHMPFGISPASTHSPALGSIGTNVYLRASIPKTHAFVLHHKQSIYRGVLEVTLAAVSEDAEDTATRRFLLPVDVEVSAD